MEISLIDIEVEGSNSQRRTNLTCSAVIYCAYHLLGAEADNLTITVKYTDELAEAGCTIFHDDCEVPLEYLIEINPDNCDNIYSTIAHEMVHVKQFYRGELQACLKLDEDGMIAYRKWNGEEWHPEPYEDAYFDSPWEVEAYGREVGLYRRWKKSLNEKSS